MLDASAIPLCTFASAKGKPSVAFDGTNYLVVFDDSRDAGLPNVYGVLVAPDGTLVGGVTAATSGFPIATASARQVAARVAFGGGSYLVRGRSLAPAPSLGRHVRTLLARTLIEWRRVTARR
jgi:hypothetical protein